jgi:Arc/MetJ-type ribon-helix-helix transcriptional regulator
MRWLSRSSSLMPSAPRATPGLDEIRTNPFPDRSEIVLDRTPNRGASSIIGSVPTEKINVTVQVASLAIVDRWVRQGRYPNRSQAIQAALDLLQARNALPTLEKTLAFGPRRRTAAERQAWNDELAAITEAQDQMEPPLS